MTDNEILNKVKTTLFGTATGSFRDDLLRIYINEVKDFMKHAGVSDNVIMSEKSVGVIALGVNDLWNYQAGGVKLSQYFIQRVIQLTDESEETPTPTEKVIKQFTWYLKTSEAETTNVVFNIPQYEAEGDNTLNVFVNGMLEIKDIDYTISDSTITFTYPKIANTEILVVVNKLVEDGGT